jgi:hypothetical protein
MKLKRNSNLSGVPANEAGAQKRARDERVSRHNLGLATYKFAGREKNRQR